MPEWLSLQLSVMLQKGRGEVREAKRGGVRRVMWREGKPECQGGGRGASRGKRWEV